MQKYPKCTFDAFVLITETTSESFKLITCVWMEWRVELKSVVKLFTQIVDMFQFQ